MRFTTKAATIAAALISSAAIAGAQVTVSGNTLGCFGTGCTTTATSVYAVPGSTGGTITFAGSAFTGMTNPSTGGFSVSNFGTFQTANFGGGNFSTPFTLSFVFSAPVGATTGTPATFTVQGNLGTDASTRDVRYTFSGAPATFNFSNGSGTITLDNGFIGSNNGATITGRVTASVVPEPSTYALMGTGLAGLIAAARRRRSA